jgi:hypothetical protein
VLGPLSRSLLVLAFVAALLFATFGMGAVECEVCLDFRGHSGCRSVSAPDREQAIAQATATLCTEFSNGVTEGMACNRAPHTGVLCSE